MRPPPRSLADPVARYLRDGNGQEGSFQIQIDEFLDAFYTETDPAGRQAMIDADPPSIGDEKQDAFVGAIGEHLARRWGLRIPEWSDATWRVVADPWFVGRMGVALSGLLLVESPITFRRRRIFTEAEPLRRARMPRD